MSKCVKCDRETGYGKREDGLRDELGEGPYCEECFMDLEPVDPSDIEYQKSLVPNPYHKDGGE